MLENSQEGWHPFARDEPSREYVPHACRAQPEPYRWSGMPRRSTLRATPTPPPLGPGRQPATPATAPAAAVGRQTRAAGIDRSEEHTSELQSLMRLPYAASCLKKNTRP